MKNLISSLIKNGVIVNGTVISGKTRLSSSNATMVDREMMYLHLEGEYLVCQDEYKKIFHIHMSKVEYIDGMEPARFAFSHSYNPDGSPYVSGKKKRGRPSKADLLARMQAQEEA